MRSRQVEADKVLPAQRLTAEKEINLQNDNDKKTPFRPQRVSPETESNGSANRLKKRTTTFMHVKRFFVREKIPSNDGIVKIHVSSLHGYSSLRMLQHGHKACASKVSGYK